MRIGYLIPGSLACTGPESGEIDRRRRYLNEHAFQGTEVVVRLAPAGPASVESAAEELQGAAALLAALPELEAEGLDALILGCFGDPGLEAARELATAPVVGPAQASMLLAAQLGDRFGILTVVHQVVPSLRRLARTYGLEPLVAAIEAVEVPVLELRRRRDQVLERLRRQGERLLEAGADTLVLGCMTLGFLDVAPALGKGLGVPVINPVLAALKAAETLAHCRLASSRRAYPRSPKAQPAGTGLGSPAPGA